MKTFLRAVLPIALCTFALSLTSRAQDIVVGEFASLTGSEATFGVNSSNGVELAREQIDSAGGLLNGRKIKIVLEDDQSKPGQPSAAVKKLIASDKSIAILGEIASSRSLEAAPICQAAKIPMITPGSTNPKVTTIGDYIFRVCFNDKFQGQADARFALENLKVKKVAILADVKSDYSQGLQRYFKEYFTSHGGVVAEERSYSGGGTDRDFRAQLTSLKSAQPDAIFIPGYYTEVGLIAKQARSLGIKVPLFGGDGWDSPKLAAIGGSALNGCYFTTHFSTQDPNPKVQDFVKNYQAKYKVMPDGMAPLGYDAMMILGDAIKTAGSTDADKIRDALTKVKNFEGVTGSITIDADRNASKSAVVLEVQNGAYKFATRIAP
ncbi:MAG: ABC transporter substrate-binding protein [Chthoniobacterales bacterium]|nr:ABC transporter substrate-binding protein [Chthoniobacterales bacterium]